MSAARRDRGATLVIAAAVLPVLILMTAFAVDLGRQRSSRRTMQARADIVSLDMVRLADGRTEDQITGVDASGGTTPALYAAYIQDTADRNHVDVSKLTIEWGTWNGVIFVQTLGNAVPDAVEVVASESTEYFFRPGSGDVTRTAVATTDDIATLSLGTTLAQASTGNATLLNQILTGLVCSQPTDPPPPAALCAQQADVSAGGYQGLATHQVTLDDLRAAGGYGSVDELMEAEFTAEGFASVSAQAFRNNGDPTTAEVYDGEDNSLRKVSRNTNRTFRFRDVVSAQSPSDGATAGASVNPYDIFMAGLQAANGDNFVDVSTAITPPVLPGGVSNFALTSRYQVIQAPKIATGRVGSWETSEDNLHTAQLRLLHTLSFDITRTVAGSTVSGRVTLPIDLSGGGAVASLTNITCAQPASNATIDSFTAPRALLGSVGTSFSDSNPATVGTLSLTLRGIPVGSVGLSAFGAVDPGAQSTSGTDLTAIAVGETRSAPGSSFGLGGAITNVKLQSTPPVEPLDPALADLSTSLAATINTLLAALDTASQPVMSALGLSVSSSDVRNIGVNCLAPRLAG